MSEIVRYWCSSWSSGPELLDKLIQHLLSFLKYFSQFHILIWILSYPCPSILWTDCEITHQGKVSSIFRNTLNDISLTFVVFTSANWLFRIRTTAQSPKIIPLKDSLISLWRIRDATTSLQLLLQIFLKQAVVTILEESLMFIASCLFSSYLTLCLSSFILPLSCYV